MKRAFELGFLGLGAFLAAFAVTERSEAQEEGPTGLELGGRLAYGIPMGRLEDDDDADLADAISGQVPLGLDLGYRVTPQLSVGAFFTYGFGFVGDDLEDLCEFADADCSARDIRVGAQVAYHLQPGQSVDPWLGAGFGYEWLTFNLSANDTDTSVTGHGFEFVNLQAGLDFPAGTGAGIGPYLGFALGQYGRTSSSCDGDCGMTTDESDEIEDKAMHQWLFLGVRGTFVL